MDYPDPMPEHRFTWHVSVEESRAKEEMVEKFREELDDLIDRYHTEAYAIGGEFRGPGAWFEIVNTFKNKVIRLP